MDVLSRCRSLGIIALAATLLSSCTAGSFEGGCVWECFNELGQRAVCGCAEVDEVACDEDEVRRAVNFYPDQHCEDLGFKLECETEDGLTYFSSERCY